MNLGIGVGQTCEPPSLAAGPGGRESRRPARAGLLVLAGAAAWLVAWRNVLAASEWLTYDVMGLARGSRLGESVAFFLYDVPKILLLLTGMIFIVTLVRSFFSTDRARQVLGGRRQGLGNVLAALLGVVTPFCSCSAVPLFIGFVEAGIPLGVTFSFLIATPMVNEVALAMLFGLFGWHVAGLYLTMGLAIAVAAGIVIGNIPDVERGVEDFVWEISVGQAPVGADGPSWDERFARAWNTTREIVGKVWPFVVIGIAVGALIHGYVPTDALSGILGADAWWSVPAGVLVGIPMYSNAAGVVPVAHALTEKGAAIGTVLAFMMSVVALSLPEVILLRRILKPRLVITFVAVVALGILIVGYVFNAVL
ncbi:MAG: permease [Anaerolineae bacterium]|jgi:hypothetical protein